MVYSTLDPRKYEAVEKDGKIIHYKDKQTGEIIWHHYEAGSILDQTTEQGFVQGFDSVELRRKACSHLKKWKSQLTKYWDGEYDLGPAEEPLKEILTRLRGEKVRIIFLRVDMAGSTRISANADDTTYQKIVQAFHMLMAEVIATFGGYVANKVGDEVIGVFPAGKKFGTVSDSSIQAAMMMRNVFADILNPFFDKKALPQAGFHTGLNICEATVGASGAYGITVTEELFGHCLNITGKIAKRARRNQILLGRDLFEVLHVTWQERCQELRPFKNWKIDDPKRGGKYQVYRFTAKWSCKKSF